MSDRDQQSSLQNRKGWEHGSNAGGWGVGFLFTVAPFRLLLMIGPWALSYGRIER